MVNSRGQMKIQQMAFMIMAVFLFFILVGLFFLNIHFKSIKKSASDLKKDKAISSLEIITNMPEFKCERKKGFCVDEDKLNVMMGEFGERYEDLWPFYSLKFYKVYPSSEFVECPEINCNYWKVYDVNSEEYQEYSTFVSICKKKIENGYVYDDCDIGKIVIGRAINAE